MSAYDPGQRRKAARGYGEGKLTGALLAWIGATVKQSWTFDRDPGGDPRTWALWFLAVFVTAFVLIELRA